MNFTQPTTKSTATSSKKQFDLLEQELIQSHLDNLRSQHLSQAMQRSVRDRVNAQKTLKRIEALEQKIEDGTYKLFKPDFHFLKFSKEKTREVSTL